jgi:hypothetical protein
VLHKSFGSSVPVELTRVDVSAPKDWDIRWVLHAHDGHQLSPVERT